MPLHTQQAQAAATGVPVASTGHAQATLPLMQAAPVQRTQAEIEKHRALSLHLMRLLRARSRPAVYRLSRLAPPSLPAPIACLQAGIK